MSVDSCSGGLRNSDLVLKEKSNIPLSSLVPSLPRRAPECEGRSALLVERTKDRTKKQYS